MPQISISVTDATGSASEGPLNYDLTLDLTIADLKSFVEAETGHSPSLQTFFFNGQPLTNDVKTLAEYDIKDGDMLALLIRPESRTAAAQGRTAQGSSDVPLDRELETLRQRLLNDRQFRNNVGRDQPQIVSAIEDPVRFREVIQNLQQEQARRQSEFNAEMARLNDDPFNEENQRKIADMIRKENVERELNATMESNPEFFANVTMLYVNVEVNGHPVKAFVDSGAQATIMSPDCAAACNITRLIDERYAGIAKGVGTARILGRVHRANVKIGDAELPCAFTVMEGKDVDMLLGLDMLRRYQACIDLAQNRLIFAGGVSVPFLPESELPKHVEEAAAKEPTVDGPDGQKVGAVSGALKPATTASSAAAAQSGPSSAANAANANFRGQGQTLGTAAPSQAAPAQPPQPPAPPASTTSPIRQEDIDQLQSLGYSREDVVAALQACDGNVEYAASLLFERY